MQLAYYLCERNNEKFQLLTYLYMACVHYARIILGVIGYNDGSGYSSGSGQQVIHSIRLAQPCDTENFSWIHLFFRIYN